MKEIYRVYVAGPYTLGNTIHNVRNAVRAADLLLERGFMPFIPHLNHFWDFLCPRPWEDWMRWDLAWLEVSDAVLRLPGESKGADQEVEVAKERGIPVFYTIPDLVEHWRGRTKDGNTPATR